MRSTLRLGILAVLLAGLTLHAIVSFDPFPGWGDDPTRLPAALSAIGPSGSMAIDALMLVAAAMLVLLAPQARGNGDLAWIAMGSIAAVSAILLTRTRAGDVDSLVLGLNWSASALAAVAIGLSARDPTCARVAAASLLGLVGLLATHAAIQYLVQNPQAYRDFLASKGDILAAHGWSPGSSLARTFERRVAQPDAGGWFGLSNVLGAVAAGCGLAFLVLLLGTSRCLRLNMQGRPRWESWLLGLGLAAALATLIFSMSKGAMVAAAGGSALLLLSKFRLKPALARVLGLACIAGPLLLVVVRGLIGTRLGELSLLFRWFYMQGAARIISGPGGATGVGPAGFQDHYMRLKPPISPENVTSPHSALLDFVSAFGVLGLAWCVMLLLAASRAGTCLAFRSQPSATDIATTTGLRGEVRLITAIAAVPTVLAAYIELEIASEWSTAVRLGGLFASAAIGTGVLMAMRRDAARTRLAIAVAALTVLAHSQVDMLATTIGSSAWFFGVLGLAWGMGSAAHSQPDQEPAQDLNHSGTRRALPALCALAVLAALGWCTPYIRTVWTWEQDLREGALAVRPVAIVNALAAGTDPSTEAQRLREAADLLANALQRRVPPNPQSIAQAQDQARVLLVDRAMSKLDAARALAPDHFGTQRATSELMLSHGLFERERGESTQSGQRLVRARSIIEQFVARHPHKATAWAWLGLLNRTLGDRTRDPDADARALDAYLQAVQEDPLGVVNIPPLVELQLKLGLTQDARKWAAQGLSRNENLRLDPLAQLPEGQRARLRAASGAP